MKLLYSVPFFFPYSYGGGQTYVYTVAKELRRRGYDVTIVTSTPWGKGSGDYKITTYTYDGLTVTAISLNPIAICEADTYSGLGPVLLKALKIILSELKPDLVHVNGLKAAFITACNELNIPHAVTAHHPGFACPIATLLRPDESLCEEPANPKWCVACCCMWKCSRRFHGNILGRIPAWIYRPAGEILNSYENVPYIGRGLMFPWLVEKVMEGQKILLNNSELIISPSQAMKRLLIRNGVMEEKICYVSHGIEPLRRSTIESTDGRPIRFGYIGRVDYAKGFHILIQALEHLEKGEKCEVHVFGGAQNKRDNDYMKKYLTELKGRTRIYDHGFVSRDSLHEAYRSIDIVVVPSIYLEVFGLVILEGFSAGRPVIVSKSGGPEELVKDGISGFVVERNDSMALADAMQKFIDNRALIVEMSKRIPPVKTIQEHVDELIKIYHRLIP